MKLKILVGTMTSTADYVAQAIQMDCADLVDEIEVTLMDGLDIYIDDYTQPDPLPAAMLKQMASAQFMGLVEEEPEKPSTAGQAVAPAGRNDPKDPAPVEPPVPSAAQPGQDVAKSGVCTAIPSTHGQASAGSTGEPASLAPASHTEHDHAHLRLQPDDAAERPGPGHSTS